MLTYLLSHLILLIVISVTSIVAQPQIAVIEFQSKGVYGDVASALTDVLVLELFRQNHFSILERELLDKILDEQKFQLSGCTTNECLVEIGKLANVHFIVAGSVARIGQTYSINARMIDIETGQVIRTALFNTSGAIDGLLTQGIRSIAAQLSGTEPMPEHQPNIGESYSSNQINQPYMPPSNTTQDKSAQEIPFSQPPTFYDYENYLSIHFGNRFAFQYRRAISKFLSVDISVGIAAPWEDFNLFESTPQGDSYDQSNTDTVYAGVDYSSLNIGLTLTPTIIPGLALSLDYVPIYMKHSYYSVGNSDSYYSESGMGYFAMVSYSIPVRNYYALTPSVGYSGGFDDWFKSFKTFSISLEMGLNRLSDISFERGW